MDLPNAFWDGTRPKNPVRFRPGFRLLSIEKKVGFPFQNEPRIETELKDRVLHHPPKPSSRNEGTVTWIPRRGRRVSFAIYDPSIPRPGTRTSKSRVRWHRWTRRTILAEHGSVLWFQILVRAREKVLRRGGRDPSEWTRDWKRGRETDRRRGRGTERDRQTRSEGDTEGRG